jgi:hypothetical protein
VVPEHSFRPMFSIVSSSDFSSNQRVG